MAHYVHFKVLVDQMVGWGPTQRCPSTSLAFLVQVNVLESYRNNSERRSKVLVTKTLPKAHF